MIPIFQILREINYCGWISVEDGVDGLDQMARSVEIPEAENR